MESAGRFGADSLCTLFDTAIGRCGVAWRGELVVAVAIGDQSDAATRRQLVRTVGHDVPQARPTELVQAAIGAMVRLLEGEPVDLNFVAVDLSEQPAFARSVYAVTRQIPPGSTLTYGEVAARIGEPGAAQAVGRALGGNPVPIVVPCHRVLGVGGKLVGFSAPGGTATKRTMLLIEGAAAVAPSLFDPF